MDKLPSLSYQGWYQYKITFIACFFPFTTYFISAAFSYLTFAPHSNCVLDTFNSFENFATRYDLYCNNSKYATFVNTGFFVGAITGVFLFSRIPDLKGRIGILKLLLVSNVFTQCITLLSSDVRFLLLFSFLSGVNVFSNSVISLLINEHMNREISGIVMTLKSNAYGIIGIFTGIYFKYIGNLTGILIFNLSMSIAVLIIGYSLVESPLWLISQRKKKEFIASMRYIGKENQSEKEFENDIKNAEVYFKEEKEKEEKSKYSLIQVLTLKSQRKNILVYSYIIFSTTLCTFGVFALLSKKIDSKEELFNDCIFSFFAEIVAEMSSGLISNYYGRKNMLALFSFMAGLMDFIEYFVPTNSRFLKTITVTSECFWYSGYNNLVFLFETEIFPIEIKSTVFGFLFTVSRMGGIIMPFFIKISVVKIIFGIMSLLSSFLVFSVTPRKLKVE